ncbi:MAG: TSUP family transporter [Deltaproteobacteria bacterium]|nr:TSUP family transporter [Deltaproteobacteria bacterium]
MSWLLVCFAALAGSGLTFFSGFGLGTLLLPVFALFFPVPTAVAMTAVVHLANNLFKLGLVGRDADWRTVGRFGFPAALAAIAGASLLAVFADLPPWATYQLAGATRAVAPVKAVVGALVLAFAVLELSPRFASLAVPARWLPVGGALSGFFGGLSGNQGALRSAFLVRLGLSKEAFVGTGAVCAVVVDVVRLCVYGAQFHASGWAVLRGDDAGMVAAATLCAFAGAWLGKRVIHKVTLVFVERMVASGMALVGLGLVAGLV